jgi:hypothetical protein
MAMLRLKPSRRSANLVLAAAAAMLAGHVHASNLPDAVLKGDYALQRVGAGELSWLGRPIYEASLWTPAGSFSGYEPGEPVALSLSYRRKFSRDELLRITSTAWRLLDSTAPGQRELWLASLRTLWSDVGPGDNVTTVVVPGKATHFYDHRGFMGKIDDPAFGPAFLSIWLDQRSVVGDLRMQLLGLESSATRR